VPSAIAAKRSSTRGGRGRGFAVVADEVRNLSVKIAAATEEIQQSIDQLQNNTQEAVNIMHHSHGSVKNSVENAEMTAASLNRIHHCVEDIVQMDASIATDSETQKQLANDVYNNILKIHDVAKETATAAQKTTSDTGNLSQYAVNLEVLAASFESSEKGTSTPNKNVDVELFQGLASCSPRPALHLLRRGYSIVHTGHAQHKRV